MMTKSYGRSYSELIKLPTYLERFDYLSLGGKVGRETFGDDRYLNQMLYNSYRWRKFREKVIIRDNGCDLACEGYEINEWRDKNGKIHKPVLLIHHINPIFVEDILQNNPSVFDFENVITTVQPTHNAIHYGDKNLLMLGPIERTQYDTCPWRR